MDRIDLHVDVPPVDVKELAENQKASEFLESSKIIKERVILARKIQQARFAEDSIHVNAEMKNSHIKKYCPLAKEVERILQQAGVKFQLSARAYLKMIKISRTIADLAGVPEIGVNHMAEALQYRQKNYGQEI